MQQTFFKNYLPKVIGLNSKTEFVIKKNQISFQVNEIKIRINYLYTFSQHTLVFGLKPIKNKRYQHVVKIKVEEPSSWYSNTIRFIIMSMILNAQKFGLKRERQNFQFSNIYLSVLNANVFTNVK